MTRPTYDAVRFDTARYRDENVAFWVARFRTLASIGASDAVVDLGCATGGFTTALGPSAIGVEVDPALVAHGREMHGPFPVVVGDVHGLPIRSATVDVAIASLLLHQVDRLVVIREAARVLRTGGRLLIRTVTPDDAARWVPHRWFPTIADVQRRRVPPIDALRGELRSAGFRNVDVSVVERTRSIVATEVEESARLDVLPRFELSPEETESGLVQLRAADGEPDVRRHTLLLARR